MKTELSMVCVRACIHVEITKGVNGDFFILKPSSDEEIIWLKFSWYEGELVK